ncbi:MAG: hypothetical protein DMF59_15375 [Acidobacteria bacterium]|nr:MAG: hypothetical protein DMF59_15375 [Acidobacteriota bacterium]
MSDSFSVVSSESWFSRIVGSIKSVLFGLFLFIVAFPVMYWNEGRAVRTAKSLTEGLGAVAPVSADSVDPAREGKLVHVSGAVKTTAAITDDEFAVSAQGVKLFRTAEMYQWKEHESKETRKKIGGGTETVTTYEYHKEWASGRIDSSNFKKPEGHHNPEASPYESKTFTANPVTVGAFTMSDEQVAQLTDSEALPVEAGAAEKLPAAVKGKVKVNDGKFYIGEDAASPQIGDSRISYRVVKPATVSLVAVQKASTFAPYQAKAGDVILLVEAGTHTAAEMFKTAQDRNAILTWILRFVGFFMMFLGLFMVFRPIAVMADILPLFGTALSAGIGLFAFLGAVVLSVVTIAVAWLVVRPVLGVALLVVAAAGIFGLIKVGRGRKAVRAAAKPVPAT